MICPRCGCNRFSFRHPSWQRSIITPFTEKVSILINLLTDPEYKEPAEPEQLMIFNCVQCQWSFLKAEGVPLQDAFAHARQ